MKEGTGGDNLSIGMRYPDGKTELPIVNNLYLIPGMNFMLCYNTSVIFIMAIWSTFTF